MQQIRANSPEIRFGGQFALRGITKSRRRFIATSDVRRTQGSGLGIAARRWWRGRRTVQIDGGLRKRRDLHPILGRLLHTPIVGRIIVETPQAGAIPGIDRLRPPDAGAR